MDQRKEQMKMNLDEFQIQKWMLQVEKVDEKNGVICIVIMFPSWVMVRKLSKKVLKFCADFSKKSRSVKPIYIYASESSHYILSENGMVYRSRSHQSWDISN